MAEGSYNKFRLELYFLRVMWTFFRIKLSKFNFQLRLSNACFWETSFLVLQIQNAQQGVSFDESAWNLHENVHGTLRIELSQETEIGFFDSSYGLINRITFELEWENVICLTIVFQFDIYSEWTRIIFEGGKRRSSFEYWIIKIHVPRLWVNTSPLYPLSRIFEFRFEISVIILFNCVLKKFQFCTFISPLYNVRNSKI